MRGFCVYFFVASAVLLCADARLIKYTDLLLHNDQTGNYIIHQSVGMYAPDDTPAGAGSPSFIELDLTFDRESSEFEGFVEIILLHSVDLPHIGYHYDDNSVGYCCSDELYDDQQCATPHQFLVDDGTTTLQQWTARFEADQSSVRLEARYNIKKTGVYHLYFASCNTKTGDVVINGLSQWKNPYGYLPGQFYILLPLYMILTIGYSLLAFFWLCLSAFHWRELSKLQGFMGIIIIFGLIEMSIVFSYWNEQNDTGNIDVGLEVAGTFFNVLKRTVSRVLLLLVSMGYGVVRPTLGSNMPKVMSFGLVYFIFAGVLEIIEDIHMNSGVNAFVRLIFIIPVAALDAGFTWIVLRSLNGTIDNLRLRKQTLKLDMYLKLSYVLMSSVAISIFCAFAQIIAESKGENGQSWETYWLIQIYWHAIYFAILVSICILWRPCQNNMRYAYSEELGDDEDNDIEENLQPLTTLVGDAKLRNVEMQQSRSPKTEPKSTPPPVKFSIDEDDDVEIATETSKLQ